MGHMRAIRPSTLTYDPYSIDRVCEALLLICRRLSSGHNQHPVAVATVLHLVLVVRLSIVSLVQVWTSQTARSKLQQSPCLHRSVVIHRSSSSHTDSLVVRDMRLVTRL
jgi:hypothetical protein